MTNFSTVAVPGTQGVWFTDNLNVGNLSAVNLTMGLAHDLVDPWGVLGIMDWVSEAAQCMLQQLVNQGAAITQAYSLSLGGPDAATGSILFGAIDTEKYEGDLMSLDLGTTLTSVHANSSSGVDDLTVGLPATVSIYVGRQELLLPAELAFNMWAIAGAEYWSEKDTATVPCSMKDSEGSFTFGLGGPAGPKVVVPMRNLVSTLSGFGDTCAFLVKNQTDPEHYHLGVPLLQSVYAVFDMSNAKLAVATPKLDSTTSNIVPFAGKAAHIPSTVSVPDQPRTVVTQTPTIYEMPTATKSFSAAAGFQSSTSDVLPPPPSASTNPAGQSDDPPEAGLTKGATIGIGVGVGVGGFVLGVLAVAFFLSRKRPKEQDLASDKFTNTSSPLPYDFQAPVLEAPVLQEYPAEMDAQPGAYELPPGEFPVEAKTLRPLRYPANAGFHPTSTRM
ncbi:hypothetical protein DL766_009335 [Monosporascus sp. MC13-8B]|nr:hypothetical protein DL763_009037 [Monosporascus cannonballus]RYP15692.1 hypothetical protein DL766_009335 [Monosporascus sp. MC13-8B]